MISRSFRAARPRSRVVGVITSRADLDFAIRMRKPPDLFELRLDRLVRIVDQLEKKLPGLRPPLIITARHPGEGGANKLSTPERRNLLSRFLSQADYVDVELRSVPVFCSLLELARKQNVRRIISAHYLKSTPSLSMLRANARAAKTHGADIFKVATRTDTPAQLARLLDFITKKDVDLAISAMGIGALGGISRVLLACAGSVLVYVSLGESDIEGQMSLEQIRALGIGTGKHRRSTSAVVAKKLTRSK
jgi:3-dehydroquinate dehydratase-1